MKVNIYITLALVAVAAVAGYAYADYAAYRSWPANAAQKGFGLFHV